MASRLATYLPNWKVAVILSSMESMAKDPQDARDQLAAADDVRDRLAAGLRMPSELLPVLAAAIAVQIGAAGAGIAEQTVGGVGVVLAGLAIFLIASAWLLQRFRQINGVRVDGLASHVVLGSGATSTMAYLGAFAAATWAAFEAQWWLVALVSIAGGVAYALGARQWWRAYRNDPAAHAGGASPRLLAGLAVIACLGFGLLVVVG